MINIDEMRKSFKQKDSIVEKLMKSEGVYCLIAEPKIGKSLLALQLANSIATGTTFLGFKTIQSPVLYISTEMDKDEVFSRINKMNCGFNTKNFMFIDQRNRESRLTLRELELDFKKFAEDLKGKFLIVDMLMGVGINSEIKLNDYQSVSQELFYTYRQLSNKYGFTFFLVHHTNKNGTTLGSTAIDGSCDGKINLTFPKNITHKINLEYTSRAYQCFNLVVQRNEHLILEVCEIEVADLDPILITLLNHCIKRKEFDSILSDVTSSLNLQIEPSNLGKLLTQYKEILNKEGLIFKQNRNSDKRLYHFKYDEPIMEND